MYIGFNLKQFGYKEKYANIFDYYCLYLYNNVKGLHHERAKLSLNDMYKGK